MEIKSVKSLNICLKKDVIIGIFEHEKNNLQPIIIEISLKAYSKENCDLNEKKIKDLVEKSLTTVCLLEHLAYIFLTKILESTKYVFFLEITIKKPQAMKEAEYAAVKITFNDEKNCEL